ncbi:MAG: hypothetical protein BWY83_03316 [bacterium ADurb.Bin478]|nr:MAG: hypothetical protein BWY83_03316 [bacterium ADurb.Bin478]
MDGFERGLFPVRVKTGRYLTRFFKIGRDHGGPGENRRIRRLEIHHNRNRAAPAERNHRLCVFGNKKTFVVIAQNDRIDMIKNLRKGAADFTGLLCRYFVRQLIVPPEQIMIINIKTGFDGGRTGSIG